jgi:MFS transporter, VNT family, synaptic vesicle glycoprotein 2
MAMTCSMMMGRLGSIAGSNLMGFALKNFCTVTFFIPAFLLISSGVIALTFKNVVRND